MTIPVTEPIAAAAAKLLSSLGWFGLAELQFIVAADGVPRLIDCNGRFYGSLSLAIAAGANLPAVWAALATGHQASRVRARPGVRYQWLEADLRRTLNARGAPRVRDVAGTVAAGVRSRHSLWDLRDPAPAAARIRRIVARG